MDGQVQAGVVVRGANIVSEVPANGEMFDASIQRFAWNKRAHKGSYYFHLSNEKDDVLYETEMKDESFCLPANIQLSPSSTYQWELRWRDPSGVLRVVTNRFSTPTAETANLIKQLKPNADATTSARVLYGLWLRSIGALSMSTSYLNQLN
jgi:hypothetical protein